MTDIVKKPEQSIIYSEEQLEEFIQCASDPIYFIKNFVKVQHPTRGALPFHLYDYQEELIDNFHNNRYSIALTGRQMGKCLEKNTKIKIKSPSGKIYDLSIGDFYKWQQFRKWFKENIERRN